MQQILNQGMRLRQETFRYESSLKCFQQEHPERNLTNALDWLFMVPLRQEWPA